MLFDDICRTGVTEQCKHEFEVFLPTACLKCKEQLAALSGALGAARWGEVKLTTLLLSAYNT